jgi:hypothetical protein
MVHGIGRETHNVITQIERVVFLARLIDLIEVRDEARQAIETLRVRIQQLEDSCAFNANTLLVPATR